jgi:hypothetical protein
VACGDAKPVAFWDGGSASSVPATAPGEAPTVACKRSPRRQFCSSVPATAPGEAPTVASLESVQVRAIG